MKTSLMLALLAAFSFLNNANAQRIIGSVKDKNDQPPEGASISIKVLLLVPALIQPGISVLKPILPAK